jgi:hypothetical protein
MGKCHRLIRSFPTSEEKMVGSFKAKVSKNVYLSGYPNLMKIGGKKIYVPFGK